MKFPGTLYASEVKECCPHGYMAALNSYAKLISAPKPRLTSQTAGAISEVRNAN
jgi:hypothetical protein